MGLGSCPAYLVGKGEAEAKQDVFGLGSLAAALDFSARQARILPPPLCAVATAQVDSTDAASA